MNETTILKLGLKPTDLDGDINSDNELVQSVTTSARLTRKALQHIVFEKLKAYFKNSQLDYSDSLGKYFVKRGRKKQWSSFRDSMDFYVPGLRTTSFAITLQFIYFATYSYFIFRLIADNLDFFIHLTLSGLTVDGLILAGAIIPLVLINNLGQTAFPTKNIDGLVDKIIQENMFDLLTSDKEKLREVLETQMREE